MFELRHLTYALDACGVPGLPFLVQSCLLIFLCGCIAHCMYSLCFHPLHRVPGPLLARLGFPLYRFMMALNLSYSWELQNLHKHYGSVVRIAQNTVSVIDPVSFQKIYYGHHPLDRSREFLKSAFTIEQLKTPSLVSERDSSAHAAKKRSIARVFGLPYLKGLEKYIDPCVTSLLGAMDKIIDDYRASGPEVSCNSDTRCAPFELSLWMRLFAADAMGELAFGGSFGLIQEGTHDAESNFILPIVNSSWFGLLAGSVPTFAPYIKWTLRKLSRHSPAIVAKRTWEYVDRRYSMLAALSDENAADSLLPKDTRSGIRSDMLMGFIKSSHPVSKNPYGPEDVATITTSMFSAGSETTSVTLSAFFYYILQNPSAYALLQAEVDAAVNEGRLHFPVSYAEGCKLEYLRACSKEAARLIPSVAMELPRVVPAGGIIAEHTSDDNMQTKRFFLPEGTEIGVSAFTYHRSQAVYGEDADEFKPERWLNLVDHEKAHMERNYFSFGGGSRVCLGKNVFLLEMTKLLPALIYHYSFSLLPRSRSSLHRRRGPNGTRSVTEPCWLDAGFAHHITVRLVRQTPLVPLRTRSY
ncbi:cytochrome P450 [Cantharellus anzutake]|uniref:cytochrome P450 n=1 Tax=Cantharellus anzutake TaxID=1750568 RepID=UPI001903810D|nr:cytochrome P450 [Cantharellus anzutake]KAF8338755.1 cytochrome P450 [Cantharellus anzutake]